MQINEKNNMFIFDIPYEPITRFKDRIVFGKLNSNNNYQGCCRIVYYDGNVLEGEFENGASLNRDVIIYQSNGCYITGKWKNDNFFQKASKFNYKEECIYYGQFMGVKMHGQGTQYHTDQRIVQFGRWENNIKKGNFKIRIDNQEIDYSYAPIQKQQNNEKQSNLSKKEGIRDFYNINKKKLQKNINDKSIIKYNFLISYNDLEKLKMGYMLSTTIVSMWAAFLSYNIKKYEKQYKTYIFGTDLIQNYAGVNLSYNNYENVRHMTNHLKNNFSLLSGFYQLILFPICHNHHYKLVAVRIKKQNSALKIQFSLYDSLRLQPTRYYNYSPYKSVPGLHLFNKIAQYLHDECHDKFSHSQKQQVIRKSLNKAEIKQVKNSFQKDGVSCGVFICKFMKQLCLNKYKYDLIQSFDQDLFRRQIYEAIKQDKYNSKTNYKQQQASQYKMQKNNDRVNNLMNNNNKKIKIISKSVIPTQMQQISKKAINLNLKTINS